MKKKIVSVVLAVAMTTTLLTACGGDKGASAPASTPQTAAPAPAPAETQAAAANDAAETDTTATDGEMVSDETFETLQENYGILVECHDAVAELYNSDEIAANPDIEEAMSQAYDIIEQMGEITQDTLTEDDAIALNDAMADLIDALSMVVDGMEAADGADAEAAADGEMVSDETFAVLQENYDILTQLYDMVAEAYNSDEVAANPEIEDAMNQAYDIIEQMGEITQDTLTEDDAVALNELMIGIVEVFQAVADEM